MNRFDEQHAARCAQIGAPGFARLAAAFYARVPADPLLAPMYPADDLAGAERRLCDFLLLRFGLDDRYARERGHPRLRMRHAPFPLDAAARDRWLALMNAALEEAVADPAARAALADFFHDVAHFLVNRPATPPGPSASSR